MTAAHPGCNGYGHAPGCPHLTGEASGIDLLVAEPDTAYEDALASLRARLDAPGPAARPLPETTGADLPALAFCSATGFDPARVKPVVNDSFVKPRGGLWLSPVTGDASSDTTGDGVPGTAWSDYVAHEQYDRAATGRVERLALAPDARVLVIDSYDDFLAARAAYPPPDTRGLAAHDLNGVQGLDFEGLAADGYAAIWLTDAGQRATHMAPDDVDLYGWDVESVLVLDAGAVRGG